LVSRLVRAPPAPRAAEYRLPAQSRAPAATAFQPLAVHLSKAAGQQIRWVTALNFLTWR